jgi:hypothetical protein
LRYPPGVIHAQRQHLFEAHEEAQELTIIVPPREHRRFEAIRKLRIGADSVEGVLRSNCDDTSLQEEDRESPSVPDRH